MALLASFMSVVANAKLPKFSPYTSQTEPSVEQRPSGAQPFEARQSTTIVAHFRAAWCKEFRVREISEARKP